MFSALKKEKPLRQNALGLYRCCMEQSRKPVFYEDYGVPDTMDGRFDLLMAHVFLTLHRLLDDKIENDPLAQALFDICFADVDQALRESGVGDMKIGKHMKKMMLAFNGRMHAYESAVKEKGSKALLEQALLRNLYATVDKADATAMAAYMKDNMAAIAQQPTDTIRAGKILFQMPRKA